MLNSNRLRAVTCLCLVVISYAGVVLADMSEVGVESEEATPSQSGLPVVTVTPQKQQGQTNPQTEAPKGPLDGFYSRTLGGEDAAPVAKPKTLNPARKPEGVNSKTQYDDINLPPTSLDDDAGGQVAMPEVTQKAMVSRSDVNRIVCRDTIKDVVYSDEKGVTVKYAGNSAYVKFQYLKVGDEIRYSTTPTELHIVCGDTTFSLVAVPGGVPTQTIRLQSGKAAKMQENIKLFRDDTAKKKVLDLIRRTYTDDLPTSFTVKRESLPPIPLFRRLAVRLERTITIDGEGLVVREFWIVPSIDGIELDERNFLRKEISLNPVAIAFEPGKLKPGKGERVRMFVVENKSAAAGNVGSGGPDVHEF